MAWMILLLVAAGLGGHVAESFAVQAVLEVQAEFLNCWDEDFSWDRCCILHQDSPRSDIKFTWNPQCDGERTASWNDTLFWLDFDLCCKHRGRQTVESLIRRTSEYIGYFLDRERDESRQRVFQTTRDFASIRTEKARTTRDMARRLSPRLGRVDQVLDAGGPEAVKASASASASALAMPAIPVLGWSVAVDETNLTLRLIRSLDFPILRLVLVLNSDDPRLEPLVAEVQRLRPDLEVVRPGQNLGCAGGWNEVLHAAPEAPWWLIASHDVVFPPGMLERIARQTQAALMRGASGGRPAPGLRHFQVRGQPVSALTLPAFALTRRAVAAVGLFDENFWPAYAEDLDFTQRMRLAGGWRVGAGLLRDQTIQIIHGPEGWAEGQHYSGTEVHMESTASLDTARGTTFSNQLHSADNYHLHYCQKFGFLGRPGNCSDIVYSAIGPFGVPGPWDDWILDPGRRACILLADIQPCGYNVALLEQ
ncbi:unnamed protein product [Polarella glacialis]|uniref:Glycosyltransferase 2-like domain-containing protein n=1 Tax=Polarella glacialis TaxID=89957 RepID=A0A813JPI5_POLGL|nr:unnamed protein product [Polarella glacialis]